MINVNGDKWSNQYNKLGRQVTMTDANGNRWGSEYDASGRKTSTVYPDGTRSSVEYDALGRKIAEIDQAGIRTEFLYDEAGNLTGVNDAEGGQTRYTYDAGGNLLTITDPNGHTTSFTYDELGRKTSRTLPEGMTEEWVYEDCCRASKHFDFNTVADGSTGPTVTYQYDSMKREILRTYADGKSIAREYNERGQIKRVIYTGYEFGPGEPYQDRVFTYDQATGRLVRDDKEDGQFIAYAYDIAGNLVETSYSGGHVVHYTHDPLNRLETVTDEHGTTRYTYDKVGNRNTMTYPNETVATYEYDSLNRLTYLENSGPDGLISSYQYTLGPAGNRVKIVEKYREPDDDQGNPSPVIEDLCEYEYDRLYRLTREARTSPKPDRTYWIEYQYDPFGNRMEMNTGGLKTYYIYDSNDRLLTESPQGKASTTYSWDDNGNMTGKTGPDPDTGLTTTWNYEWNYDNKMERAEKNGQFEASYAYDFQGERIHKTTSTDETAFLIDNNNQTGYSQALKEVDVNNDEIVAYTFGDDLISQDREELSFLHYDGLGSTRVLTSMAAATTDTFAYLAFGTLLNRTGLTKATHLFTGDAYDFNLGYYYLRARLYNAFSGIFISSDTFTGSQYLPQSIHKYSYSYNNPQNYTDPTGNWTVIDTMMTIGIIGILLALATAPFAFYATGRKAKGMQRQCDEPGNGKCNYKIWSGYYFSFTVSSNVLTYLLNSALYNFNFTPTFGTAFNVTIGEATCWGQNLSVETLTVCGAISGSLPTTMPTISIGKDFKPRLFDIGVSVEAIGNFCFTECKNDFSGSTFEGGVSFGTPGLASVTGSTIIFSFGAEYPCYCSSFQVGITLFNRRQPQVPVDIQGALCHTWIIE